MDYHNPWYLANILPSPCILEKNIEHGHNIGQNFQHQTAQVGVFIKHAQFAHVFLIILENIINLISCLNLYFE